jgi:predicted RNase H-like nuclease (RuvC/YqgF family)
MRSSFSNKEKSNVREKVTHFRLIKMLMNEEPDILAVDSIQEIAENQHELCTFMQVLPPITKLVQVTGGEKRETLGKVAAKYNISFNRFDPFAEARTIAKVAYLGGGTGAAVSYAKSMLILLPAWVLYVVGVILLLPRLGLALSLVVSVAAYLGAAFLTMKLT